MTNFTAEEYEVLRAALAKYGERSQVDMVLEEMAELAKAVLHYRRGRGTLHAVTEELADVLIMAEQLRMMCGPVYVDQVIRLKIKRLAMRMLEEK